MIGIIKVMKWNNKLVKVNLLVNKVSNQWRQIYQSLTLRIKYLISKLYRVNLKNWVKLLNICDLLFKIKHLFKIYLLLRLLFSLHPRLHQFQLFGQIFWLRVEIIDHYQIFRRLINSEIMKKLISTNKRDYHSHQGMQHGSQNTRQKYQWNQLNENFHQK